MVKDCALRYTMTEVTTQTEARALRHMRGGRAGHRDTQFDYVIKSGHVDS